MWKNSNYEVLCVYKGLLSEYQTLWASNHMCPQYCPCNSPKYRPCCSLLGQCWPQKTCYKGNWSRIIIWILRYLLTDTCIMPNVLNCDNQGRIDWTNHLIHRAHAIPVWGYHRIRKSACTEISSGSRFKVQYNYVLELSLLYCQERWMWNTLEEWHKWIYNDGIVTWNILEG